MFELIHVNPGLVCVLLGVGACLGLLLAAARRDGVSEVILVSAGARRIAVIKALREHLALSLLDAKRLTDAPETRVASLPTAEATRLAEALREVGATVRVQGRLSLPGEQARGLTRVRVREHERVFVHRADGFQGMLRPGTHRVWGRAGLVRVSTLDRQLLTPHLPTYLADRAVVTGAGLIVVELGLERRALVWEGGRLLTVLGPGRYAFWDHGRGDDPQRGGGGLRIERVDVSPRDPRYVRAQLESILAAPTQGTALRGLEVPAGYVGLLRVDGRLLDELAPGRIAVWDDLAKVTLDLVDTRRRTVEVVTPVWTRDKVELSLTVSADFRVHAARVAAETLDREVGQAVQGRVAQAVGVAVAQRAFDDLATGASGLTAELERELGPRLRNLGVTLERVGLTRLDPPGDVRALLIKAVEARTRAEAERVTRREETAAARSQLNTARLLERSPELRRLRELEAAERIAARVGSLQVTTGHGGLTRLAERLIPRRQA